MNSYESILLELDKGITGIEAARRMLRENIRDEINTRNGSKKPASIIKSMFTRLDKFERPRFEFANVYGDRFAFLDGHRLYISDSSFGYPVKDHTCGGFKVDQIINVDMDGYTELKIDIRELEYFLKTNKPPKKGTPTPYIIRTPDGFACYNPLYLLDLLKYTESDTILYKDARAPIYSKDKNALTLPINSKYMNEDKYLEYRDKYFIAA